MMVRFITKKGKDGKNRRIPLDAGKRLLPLPSPGQMERQRKADAKFEETKKKERHEAVKYRRKANAANFETTLNLFDHDIISMRDALRQMDSAKLPPQKRKELEQAISSTMAGATRRMLALGAMDEKLKRPDPFEKQDRTTKRIEDKERSLLGYRNSLLREFGKLMEWKSGRRR